MGVLEINAVLLINHIHLFRFVQKEITLTKLQHGSQLFIIYVLTLRVYLVWGKECLLIRQSST